MKAAILPHFQQQVICPAFIITPASLTEEQPDSQIIINNYKQGFFVFVFIAADLLKRNHIHNKSSQIWEHTDLMRVW